MTQCKTIQLLTDLVAANSEWKMIASSCLDIIENINESGLTPAGIHYLHEFVDAIYKEGNISLLDHLRDGSADCRICKEMASRMGVIAV